MPEQTTDKKLMIRPVDLPIYGFPEEQESKAVVEHSETYQAALGAVGEARLLVQAGWGQLSGAKETVDHVVNTGIAHTAGMDPILLFQTRSSLLASCNQSMGSTSSFAIKKAGLTLPTN